MSRSTEPRAIAIVTYPGVQSLDVTGPLEVFAGAQRLLEVRHSHRAAAMSRARLSRDGQPLRTSSGLTLTPDGSLRDAPEQIDTLIVAGGVRTREAAPTGR